jgi:glucokinase
LSIRKSKREIKGIGLSVSGIVNHVTNEILHSTNFDIAGKGLAKKIETKYKLPVCMDNRPNAAALAESVAGAGKSFKNFIYITTGRGVGAGIINNGKIFTGSFGGAGEIGKMILFSKKDFIANNMEASLERRMRENYLVGKAEEAKGKKLTFREILKLYKEGDSDIEKIIRENAEDFACAASIICNFFNPEALILGGRKKELGEKYLEYFDKVFKEHFANPFTGKTKVLLSSFGRDGVALGGAMLILDKVINLEIN